MTIPDFQSLMRPVLAVLGDGQTHTSRELRGVMADQFNLSPAEREQMLPSGRQRVIDNRVGWALTYLVQAGSPVGRSAPISRSPTPDAERCTTILPGST